MELVSGKIVHTWKKVDWYVILQILYQMIYLRPYVLSNIRVIINGIVYLLKTIFRRTYRSWRTKAVTGTFVILDLQFFRKRENRF